MTAYKDHRLAALLPLLTQPELRDLADDIKAHGLLAPVTLFEGKILDGRNRYRACKLAGVEPKLREFKGDDPLAFILSANVHRRHLNESQRAMIAARVATMHEGRPSKTASRDAVSQTDAAKQLDVSRASVTRAKQVLQDGSAEEIEAVEQGQKTVNEVVRDIKANRARPAEVLDKTGHPVPEKILPDWRHAETFQPLLTDISRVKSAVERGLADGDLAFREVSNTLVAELGSVYAQLKQLLPYAVCTSCQGHSRASCMLCKGRGYLSQFAWRQYVPEETKEVRRRASACAP